MSRSPSKSDCATVLVRSVVCAGLLLAARLPALALELDEAGPEQSEIAPAPLVVTNEAVNDKAVLIIEDVEPTNAPVAVETPGLNVPSEPGTPAPARPAPIPDHSGILNSARQYALGMIETGNNDKAIGGLGEVSRYQIMPSVWKSYSSSRSYRDLDVATEVARQHWASLYEYFKKKADREPTNFDMYVLWNTRHGYYAGRGFTPERLHAVVRDRAQRFTNLVEDSQRRESELAMANLR